MQRLFIGHCQGQQTDFMKKGLFLLLSNTLLILSSCEKEKETEQVPYGNCFQEMSTTCFKGRLEIMGICGNYTIKLLEGRIDSNLIQQSWVHPRTGETLTNVFGLTNICDLPASIKEGDEFYFQIKNYTENSCTNCLAYYPTPNKKLSIQTQSESCNVLSTP